MVFNSFTFAAFFAVMLVLHSPPLSWTVKKFKLLVASYLFYAAWNPPFVLLLIGTTAVDFVLARAVMITEPPFRGELAVAASIVNNLGLLGFFKHAFCPPARLPLRPA
jgi:D-alanyl-lipoteichoic acid acyltransferase DltB (MBOAT superfamily)